MADKLDSLLKYWAADREAVSVLDISELTFDYDTDVFEGSDVTPPEWPQVIVKYTVTKKVIHSVPINEMGDFICDLAEVGRRGPVF